ncbi:hypothetical protein D4R78_02140 [bacterium]|nr:MAG: hypothetical protein D4R78_02140 [bacterium]
MARTLRWHAAGIIRNRKGYLFLGCSGAGKSTICGLSKGALIIHDDKIDLAKIRGKVYIHRSVKKKFYQINSIFFIFQARSNRIGNISIAKALKHMLTDSVAEFKRVLYSKNFQSSKYIFNFMLDMLGSIPYHKLYFKKGAGFWKTIDKLEVEINKKTPKSL